MPQTAARARLLGLDPRYRCSAAFTHATGLAPWDPEVPRLYDLARDLDGRPEAAIERAVITAALTSEDGPARRAGRVEAVVAALEGLEYDGESPQLAGLAEYARQLRAALAARSRGLGAQDAAIAAAARVIAGRAEDDGTGAVGQSLAEAAAALGEGDRSSAWHSLSAVRRRALGEHTAVGLITPLADGTAAHEQIGTLIGQLAPTAPPVGGGTFADLLHAGDVDATAGKVVTREEPRWGLDDPIAQAVQAQLRDAARALRDGNRDQAANLLTTAGQAASENGILVSYRPAGPAIDRHLARLRARAAGEPQTVGSYTEQGTEIARRLRAADPDGPPQLVRIRASGTGRLTAVDHAGRLFDVELTGGGTDSPAEVSVALGERSLTAQVRSAGLDLAARQLAGRLTGEWKARRVRLSDGEKAAAPGARKPPGPVRTTARQRAQGAITAPRPWCARPITRGFLSSGSSRRHRVARRPTAWPAEGLTAANAPRGRLLRASSFPHL
jgi:hypothetical protein